MPQFLRTISADCSRRLADTHHDQYGVHGLDLPALFRVQPKENL